MKRLAVAAAGAVVMGLTACTHGAAPSAAPAKQGTGKPIAPVSCSSQYRAWNHGEGKGLLRALDAVSSATHARHARVPKAALKQARQAVAEAARHPIPACADPRGYWDVLLMHVDAAVAAKGSTSSVRAAMQGVPKIHHQLLAEITQTAQ